MHGPPLIGWLLTALCGVSAVYCLLRMRAGPSARRGEAGGEALMGLGMAAMAVPVAAVSGQGWLPAAFAGVFGLSCAVSLALAAASPWRGSAGLHHGHHAVSSAAMVHMGLAMSAAPHASGHAGHGAATQQTGGLPLLTGALLGYFALYALWTGLRLAPLPAAVRGTAAAGAPGAAAAGGPEGPVSVVRGAAGRSPGSGGSGSGDLLTVCRLVMAMAMAAMLMTL
ncbi:DUF5134 domain-containing protein [Streptomyces sp. WAC 00631]|uniref:DUF5134 domain-containing protein n=1 Tax=unclassified Streptomyces TaxID=2593676 RepID=UPI000F787A24|nr:MULTISPECIES: DUF5134 domain-containing protein [unclassified Streptomyces]MCC5036820.1 DUF5134 domain-containing protein [Streptomyces sp. WAC 00631]MCC9738044.1 DUF5134 domain-containing protein [Streptomyces sp. MNU89]